MKSLLDMSPYALHAGLRAMFRDHQYARRLQSIATNEDEKWSPPAWGRVEYIASGKERTGEESQQRYVKRRASVRRRMRITCGALGLKQPNGRTFAAKRGALALLDSDRL